MANPDERHHSRGSDRMSESGKVLARPAVRARETAIVVVDMINHQLTPGVAMLGSLAADGIELDYLIGRVNEVVIPAHQRLLAVARAAGARVVYLRVGAASPDHGDAIPAFRGIFNEWDAVDGSWQCEVIEAIAPQPGDLSLLKTGSGGFLTSGLDSHLRNLGIKHIAYTGVITNACVLLTLGAGFDLGYYGYLISDATATFSQRLQDVTEEIVSGYMAKVVSADDFAALLAAVPAVAEGRSGAGDAAD
jgi:nicotinamidase-related amidase